jgi:peptidoglycan/LPS O-acetylase OafA/YrhL
VKEKTDHTAQQQFYGLDFLRAFAITIVFLFHYFILSHGQPEWLPNLASFGWTGVDLFFVLSGFLISSQLFSLIKEGQGISLKEFFLKRFFRILPSFWVTVGLYFCFPLFREKEALPPLWEFLTFTQNLGLNLKDFGTFSHAWSLCVEEHFYLLLPVLLIFLQVCKLFNKSYWLLIALFVFGFVVRIYSFNSLYLPRIAEDDGWMYWYKYIYYPTYNRLDGLLIGVAISGIYHFLPQFWNRISKYGNRFIILSLLVLTGAYFLCQDPQSYHASVFGFPLVALGYGLMVIGAISPSSYLFTLDSALMAGIARLSYAIYLTHKGIIHLVHSLLADFDLNSHLLLLLCMVCCILGALLLNLIVEQPFMKLRNRIIKLNKSKDKLIEVHS